MENVVGIVYVYIILSAIILAKGMVNDYSIVFLFGIVSVFWMQYGLRKVKTFKIFIGKK